MLTIAVCDDEKAALEKNCDLLKSYLADHPEWDGRIWAFSSSEALLIEAEKQGGFDLYVLDILMPQVSGIDTGRRLRALGHGGEIIYLTSSNDFASDSYDVRAFFYLLKPAHEKKLFQVLDGAIEQLRRRRSSAIIVHTAEGPRRLLLEHIRYAERCGRVIRYHCMDETFDSQTIRSPFREVAAPLLADRRFYLCGASFVLNFQHVTGVNGQTALLDNGKTVVLPRTSAAEFKKAWGNYWLEERHVW